MDNKNKFLYTTSKSSADQLLKQGFKLIQEANNHFFFLNESNKFVFGSVDKVAYTDKLFF